MTGSVRRRAGLRQRAAGDYNQNWYDQGIAVDPNNADNIFVDTYDVWRGTRNGTSFTDLTCGYSGGETVHVDQHALAFVPRLVRHPADRQRRRHVRDDATPTHRLRPGELLQHGRRAEHDRVLLGRRQRLLRDVGQPVGSRRRAGQRPERRPGSRRRPDRPGAVAAGHRRRRLPGPDRSGRLRLDRGPVPALLHDEQQRRAVPLRLERDNTCLQRRRGRRLRRRLERRSGSRSSCRIDIFHGGIPGGDDCGPPGATTGCGHLLDGTYRVWETVGGATGPATGTSRTART